MLLERPLPVTNPDVLCGWNCWPTASLCCVIIGWVVVNRNWKKTKKINCFVDDKILSC